VNGKWLWTSVLAGILVAGCGGGGSMGADVSGAVGNQNQDYGTTKQMVIDILHSPDGKKAVAEMLSDPSVKQKVVVSETDISKAVEKTLETKKNQSFLAQQAKEPEFAAALAKAIQPDLVNLQKQLMKDPEYQKDMMVLLKSPEFTKQLEELLQTPQFRGQVMKIMTDALQTPSFRMQFQSALQKAVAQQMHAAGGQGQKGQQGGKSEGEGSISGDGGSGEGDGGGGGS
jgi:spore germination protein D